MLSKDEIREEGLRVVQGHLRRIVEDPRHAFITFRVETRDGIGASKRTWRYGSYEDRVNGDVEAAIAAAKSDSLFADQIRYAAKGIAGS